MTFFLLYVTRLFFIFSLQFFFIIYLLLQNYLLLVFLFLFFLLFSPRYKPQRGIVTLDFMTTVKRISVEMYHTRDLYIILNA